MSFVARLQEQKSIYRAREEFNPPAQIVSMFKEHLRIELNPANCGTKRQIKKDEQNFALFSHGGERAKWQEFPWLTSIYVHGFRI